MNRAPNEGRFPGRSGHSICVAISKIRAAENPWIFSGSLFSFWVLFRVFAIGAGPVLCRVQKGGVAVGADVLQRLMVFAVFVARGKDWMISQDSYSPQSPQVTPPLDRQHFFILHLARLKSREPSRYPVLQPLQVFRYSRQVPQ